MKVYVFEGDLTGTLGEIVKKRDALGKALGALAVQAETPVFFHEITSNVFGAPFVLVECEPDVLELMQKLPECKKAYDVWPNVSTERSFRLWRNFTGTFRKLSRTASRGPGL